MDYERRQIWDLIQEAGYKQQDIYNMDKMLFIARASILCVYVTVQGLKPSYFIWLLIGQVGMSLQRTEKWALVLYLSLQVSSNILPLSI